MYALHTSKKYSDKYPYKFFDTIISISGTLVLTAIAGVIIYISQVNAYKSSHILERTFDEKSIQTQSGITLSPVFQAIDNFTFTRANDQIKFIGQTATGYIQYPSKENFKMPPNQEFATKDINFTIQDKNLLKDNQKHSEIQYR